MKEKLATAVVGTVIAIGLALFLGDVPELIQLVVTKIVGLVAIIVGGILYKFFEKKGLFYKTYAEWGKECLTNKD